MTEFKKYRNKETGEIILASPMNNGCYLLCEMNYPAIKEEEFSKKYEELKENV